MNNKQIAKNTIFLYIRLGFSLIVSLITVRIVLGALGEVDYGIYNVVAGFVSMLGFMNVSLVNGVQRFYNFEYGKQGFNGLRDVYKSAIRIQIVLAVIILLIIETIGIWYLNYKMVIPENRLVEANCLMQLSLLSLLFGMLQVPYTAILICSERFNAYAYFGIIEVFLRLGAAFSLIIFTINRLDIYGGLLTLISLINLMFYYLYCRRNYKGLFKSGRANKNLTLSMIKFMGWNTFGSGAYIFRTQGINLLLNSYFGVILNAANGIANQISGAVSSFAQNLVTAFKPQMVQEYAAGNPHRSFGLMVLMTKTSFALIYILSIPIILDIDYILELWLGDEVPDYTASLSCLVLVSICISCWHTPIVQMFQTIGKMSRFQLVTSAVILSIIVFTWLGFYLGLNPDSAYYVTIFAYIFNQVAAVVMLKRLYDFSIWKYFKTAILPCLFFAILFPIIPWYYTINSHHSIYQLTILCLISFVVAIPLVYYVILNVAERENLYSFLKLKLK